MSDDNELMFESFITPAEVRKRLNITVSTVPVRAKDEDVEEDT